MNQFKKVAPAPTSTRADNPRDFTELFQNSFDQLLKKTNRYVRDIEAAKDIVQETLAKIWDNQSHLQHGEYIQAYLERACINRALNHLRDQRKFSDDPQELCTVVQMESPHTTMTYRELHEGIMNYIEKFPDHMRSAFILSRFHNMSYREISQNLGISVVSVERRMMKALKQLREFVARSGLKLFLFFALSVELKASRGTTLVQQPLSMASLSRRLGS